MRSRTLTLLLATTFPVLLSACDDTSHSERDVADLQELIDDTTLDVADDADDDTPQVTCGDGVLHPDEGCDDGNTADGDGCSATCQVEPPEGVCEAAGESCDPVLEQPAPWVCVDNEEVGSPMCAQQCTDFSECPPGTYCTVEGYCTAPDLPECTSFWDEESCEPDEQCVPVGDGEYGCEPTSISEPDCLAHADCSKGMLCLSSVCTAPDCNPYTSEPACPDDLTCEALTLDGYTYDAGFCIARCEAFDLDMCPDGEWCFPDDRDENTGLIEGQCVESLGGAVPDGDDCGMMGTACLDGSLCIGSETDAQCRQLCDPMSATSGVGACGAMQLCGSLVGADGNALDWGTCFEACTAYVDKTMSGCDAATEWCFPSQTQAGVGQCSPNGSGTVTEYGLCGDDYDGNGNVDTYETCGAGLFCLGFSETEGRCVLPCDPTAAMGDDGHCTSVSDYTECTCGELSDGMNTLAFGFIQEGCTYNHGGARTDCMNQGTCVPGELFGSTDTDVCTEVPNPGLAEFDNCTDAGLAEGDICSTNGICLILNQLGGPEVLCYELCTTAEGAFNTSMHPDCSRGTAVCTQLFMSTEFGLCAEDAM